MRGLTRHFRAAFARKCSVCPRIARIARIAPKDQSGRHRSVATTVDCQEFGPTRSCFRFFHMFQSPHCPERPIRTASLRSHHSGLSRIRADGVASPIFSHVPDEIFPGRSCAEIFRLSPYCPARAIRTAVFPTKHQSAMRRQIKEFGHTLSRSATSRVRQIVTSTLQPPIEPRKRLLLHLPVELVRPIVEARPIAVRRARLLIHLGKDAVRPFHLRHRE